MKKRTAFVGIAIVGVLTSTGFARAADLVIGVPNWPSVRATANVLKVVLEDNLGLDVELQNGTNPIIFEAMDSGAMQVHPEVWLPNQVNLTDKFVKDKGTVRMNPNGVVSDQAICVTKDTQERTGISELSELTDPDIAAQFDTDGDGKGELWIGVAGWASTNVEKIRAKSYGYSETMKLKEMDEALALAEVDNAIAQGHNIAFYCYTPHHMFALYDLVILNEPEHDPAKWKVVHPTDDPQWLEKSDAPVAWSPSFLHLHFASALEETNPEAASVLSKFKLDTDIVSKMTYALVVKKLDPQEFAHKWVEENSDLVDSWLN
ncbi:MAG: glycine betaine ABC transporter substrate-binding protein [Pseudomonadota bacterium]